MGDSTKRLKGDDAADVLDGIASEDAINYEELDKVLSTIDFESIIDQESIDKLDDAVTTILKRIEKEQHYAFSENFPKLDKLLLKLTETGLNYKQLSDIYTLHKKATGVLERGGDVQRAYNKDKGSPVMAKLDTALQDVDNKFRLALRVKVAEKLQPLQDKLAKLQEQNDILKGKFFRCFYKKEIKACSDKIQTEILNIHNLEGTIVPHVPAKESLSFSNIFSNLVGKIFCCEKKHTQVVPSPVAVRSL